MKKVMLQYLIKASGGVVLFSDSKYDMSDLVLEKLGYKK